MRIRTGEAKICAPNVAPHTWLASRLASIDTITWASLSGGHPYRLAREMSKPDRMQYQDKIHIAHGFPILISFTIGAWVLF